MDPTNIKTENGIVSESMGVNTKPAHRLQYGKYWVLVDPDMPEHTLNKLFPNMLTYKSQEDKTFGGTDVLHNPQA
jgi:hypothetical protein